MQTDIETCTEIYTLSHPIVRQNLQRQPYVHTHTHKHSGMINIHVMADGPHCCIIATVYNLAKLLQLLNYPTQLKMRPLQTREWFSIRCMEIIWGDHYLFPSPDRVWHACISNGVLIAWFTQIHVFSKLCHDAHSNLVFPVFFITLNKIQ